MVLGSGTVGAVVSPLNSAILLLLIAADCKVTALASNLSRMTSVWELANRQLRGLAVYEPGKPIEETARELDIHPAEIVDFNVRKSRVRVLLGYCRRANGEEDGNGRTDFRKDISGVFHLFSSPIFYQFW